METLQDQSHYNGDRMQSEKDRRGFLFELVYEFRDILAKYLIWKTSLDEIQDLIYIFIKAMLTNDCDNEQLVVFLRFYIWREVVDRLDLEEDYKRWVNFTIARAIEWLCWPSQSRDMSTKWVTKILDRIRSLWNDRMTQQSH